MHEYQKARRALLLGALGLGITACGEGTQTADKAPSHSPQGSTVAPNTESSKPTPEPTSAAALSANPVKVQQRWPGVVTELPGEGNFLAWTVDDGASAEVIRSYAHMMQVTGTRITFFVNGKFAANFEQNLDVLLPLVDSGQLQIGNHTYSHTALTSLTDAQIQHELLRNDEWNTKTFGVSSAPYFRAPYGYYDSRVLAAAAAVGFTRPVQWYGSFADSGQIPGSEILKLAQEYVHAQAIVIGHLNYSSITEVFDPLHQLIQDRNLQTVTLRDYFI